jgi:anti-anti-sigma regulatory factor
MLRISIVEGRSQRQLVLEGRLVSPWVDVLKTAYENAKADSNGRQLVIDLRNLTTISNQGESLLLELMKQGVRFRCSGVFAKEVLKEVGRRLPGNGRYK